MVKVVKIICNVLERSSIKNLVSNSVKSSLDFAIAISQSPLYGVQGNNYGYIFNMYELL